MFYYIWFIRNRINKPIVDYAFDGRVNLVSGDPHRASYVTNRVDLKQPVKIVEGPIDSLFLKNAIASGDANLKLCAEEVGLDNVILIFDNEPRNKEVCKLILKAINLHYNVVIWPATTKGKDINEMVLSGKSVGEIESIISSNTFRDIEATLKFNMWKKV